MSNKVFVMLPVLLKPTKYLVRSLWSGERRPATRMCQIFVHGRDVRVSTTVALGKSKVTTVKCRTHADALVEAQRRWDEKSRQGYVERS